MPGVILAVLDDPDETPALLGAARCLAELSGGAAIHALIARTPPQSTIVATEEVLTRRRESAIRAQELARAAHLAAIFQDWAPAMRGPSQLIDVEAIAAAAITERGPGADFVVIGQSARRQHGPGARAILAALFDTDRPVLVVPPGCRQDFGRRIALAWRDDSRTIRAVLAAMRCLGHAERMLVLAGQREGAAPPRLPDILEEHGVTAELVVLPLGGPEFGETVLGKAHELGADMLVMGAYAHDPVRDLVLGGLTKYMLSHCDLPLLMRH